MVVPGPDWKPINVLLEPEIFVFAGVPVRPASEPTAVLELPVLLSKSALLPIAVLFEPVPSLWREEVPIAVLLFPVRLKLPANSPRKVLFDPVLCAKRIPAIVITPTPPENAVSGSARLDCRVSVCAAKSPFASRLTMALDVLVFVGATIQLKVKL